jgi:hypothetical protein
VYAIGHRSRGSEQRVPLQRAPRNGDRGTMARQAGTRGNDAMAVSRAATLSASSCIVPER